MDVIRKDATITNTDDAFPGSFEVILSAPTKDRDGETLLASEWKQPLPEHITFDRDHEMSVKGTVGSGTPRIDEEGRLIVAGTYSSLPHAQETRTLVKEGHIRTTSVAFMTEKSQKDGTTVVTRELLNGAFVAIPSNREALVLSAKAVKAGARNSKSDAERIQAIHDHALALGAVSPTGKSFLTTKDAAGEQIAAIDAALDQAAILFRSVDTTTLPAEVQQAIDLVTAAEASVDELLDALGIQDPDEDADSAASETDAAASAAAPKAAAAAAADVKEAAVEDHASEIQARAARMRLFSLITGRN